MSTRFPLSPLSAAIALLLTTPATYAQADDATANDSANGPIERISVTANRKANLDTELPMSVDSIGEQELNLDNGQHVAESLNSIAGVLVNQLQGAQGHNAAIRMPINYGGYYLYLQDNIPLQSPAFFNHNALWWSSFNSNVSRLEVLKGAGTALYGSGAVAATVNVLSKDIADRPETRSELVTGEEGYGKVKLSHSERLSADSAYRVAGSYMKNDGWRDHTGSKRGELTLRHEYELGDSERLVSSLVVSDLEQEMAASLSEDQYKADPTHSGLTDAVLATDPTRKTQYLRLSTQWDKFVSDQLYVSMIPYFRHRTNDYTATWNNNMPKVESGVDSLGLLALSNWEHQDGSETTLGLDIEVSEGDQLSYQPLTITTTGWGADTFVEGEKFYDDTTRYTGLSPYAQHKRQLSENLQLTLGARYDYAGYDFDNNLGRVGDIGHGKISLADREDSFNHLSPKASLNYQLGDESSVYARYANAFRLPSAGSLYHRKKGDSNNDIANLKPEVSDTFELGYKANWDRLTLDLAVYRMDVDDAIVNAYDDNGTRYQTNAGRVIHQGVEMAADWRIDDNLDLSLTYSKSKHEFDRFVVDAGRVDRKGNSKEKNYSGNEMKMAPDYMANLRLRYRPTAIAGLSTMLEVQSIGDYWMDDENSRDYKGYTLLNLKGHYQISPQLSLHARILNLTDKEYAQQAEIRYGKARFAPGAPRTAYLSLNYQW